MERSRRGKRRPFDYARPSFDSSIRHTTPGSAQGAPVWSDKVRFVYKVELKLRGVILVPAIRRDASAGVISGLLAGLLLALLVGLQDYPSAANGMATLAPMGAGLAWHFVFSALLGAGFGVLFRYQPQGYAGTLSNGLLFGLLLWILGPLTLYPPLRGTGPGWSAAEASDAFPALISYLLFSGLLAIGFHILVTLQWRLFPGWVREVSPLVAPTTRIVILSGGYAGAGAAQRLERIFSRDPNVEIVLVSQSNFMLHTPMLSDVAAGGLEPQHISAPLRGTCPRTRFYHATVEGVDPSAQTVTIRATPATPRKTLRYDHLVLALGAAPNYYGLPGLEANSLPLKTLADATRMRNHIIGLFERADVEPNAAVRKQQLTFVVAGAGFAGTEMLAVLFDMAHSILRYYPNIPREDMRFVMVHSRDRILPELSPELADYAQRKLAARGIEFLLGQRVMGATPDAVLLGDGSQVSTRSLVWTAGNQPNPFLRSLGFERDARGAVIAEGTLQVAGHTNVWAVGDCAAIPDPDNDGRSFPPTAQHAMRQGKVVADNIAAVLRGKPPKPFHFRTLGLLVAVGQRTAAAEIRGYRFSGLLAWLMWRTIYWSKLPGLEKKARVALDWLIELFFPRDIVLTADPAGSAGAQGIGEGHETGTDHA